MNQNLSANEKIYDLNKNLQYEMNDPLKSH